MKLINDVKNTLLKRRELKAVVQLDKIPTFESSAKMVSEQYKAEEDVIVVKGIKGKFGRNTFLIDAMIYDSVIDKERIEPKKKVKKEAAV